MDLDTWLVQGAANGVTSLYVTGPGTEQQVVPLKSRRVQAHVYCEAAFADTKETLLYEADKDCNVVFKFPLPPRSAVYRFQATFGDKVIRTEVKRKAEAVAEFQTAQQQGHTPALLQQAPDSATFSVDLGNLAAGQACELEFSYVRKLERVGDSLEYVHTATWVPPYKSAEAVAAPDESTPAFAAKVGYSLSYEVHVVSHSQIVGVSSPSHGDALHAAEGDDIMMLTESGEEEKTVILSEEVADPSKDFSLLVELADAGPSRLLLQDCPRAGRTKTIAQACFNIPKATSAIPGTGSASQTEQAAGGQPKREVWFVVDCSGSMSGRPEVQARDAAAFFVKDLSSDQGILFNMVTFGSSWSFWSASSCRPYTEETAAEAGRWIQENVHANMGGTEILGTLKAVYAVPVTKDCIRDIIFLTDGGISGSEESAVFNLVGSSAAGSQSGGSSGGGVMGMVGRVLRRSQEAATVHCLGIGHGVHRSLLDGMAERSGGVAQYVVSDADIAPKAGFLKRCALAPDALRSPRLLPRSCLLRPAPAVLPPGIFPGQPLMVLAEIVKAEEGAAIALEAERPDGSKLVISLTLEGAARLPGDAMAVLHGMSYIGGLLSGNSVLHLRPDGSPVQPPPAESTVTDEVVRVAMEEGLVTPHTAAVGVLLRADPLDPSKSTNVEVPLQVPHGRTLWNQPEDTMDFGGRGRVFRSAQRCRGGPSFGAPMMSSPAPMMSSFAPRGGALMMMSAAPAPPPGCGPQALAGGPASVAAASARAPLDALLERGECIVTNVEKCRELNEAEKFHMAGRRLNRRETGGWTPTKMMKKAFGAFGGAPRSAPEVGGGGSMEGGGLARSAFTEEGDTRDMSAMSAPKAAAAAVAPMPPRSVPQPAAKFDARETLRTLNGLRTIHGFWDPSPQLTAALALKPPSDPSSNPTPTPTDPSPPPKTLPAGPEGLEGAVWATVLVLAFLRRHLAAEEGLWEAMAAKALRWLKANWPAGVQPGPGAAVIGAMKLV